MLTERIMWRLTHDWDAAVWFTSVKLCISYQIHYVESLYISSVNFKSAPVKNVPVDQSCFKFSPPNDKDG